MLLWVTERFQEPMTLWQTILNSTLFESLGFFIFFEGLLNVITFWVTYSSKNLS